LRADAALFNNLLDNQRSGKMSRGNMINTPVTGTGNLTSAVKKLNGGLIAYLQYHRISDRLDSAKI
jgi:hypothetical protein